MVFSSVLFLFYFLPAALLGYYLIRSNLRNLFLLAASLFFYAWGEPKFVLAMLLVIAISYAGGVALGAADAKAANDVTATGGGHYASSSLLRQ